MHTHADLIRHVVVVVEKWERAANGNSRKEKGPKEWQTY
jgi:hypothetical protein